MNVWFSSRSVFRISDIVTSRLGGFNFAKQQRWGSSLPYRDIPTLSSPELVEDLEPVISNVSDRWNVQRERIETIRLKTDAQFKDYYKLDKCETEPVGYGTFGSIYSCRSKVPNSATLAVKVMQKSQQPYYQREIEMLKRVNHFSSCVKLMRVLESPHKVYLITELLTGGDLFDYIVDHNVSLGTLSFRQALQITKMMLLSLEACHIQNLAHLDVKPENYVFREPVDVSDPDHLEKAELVLVDFGAAQPFLLRPYARNSASYERGMDEFWAGMQETKITGTASYISPEIFLLNRFSSRSDMWSLGVSLYMILTGERPFDSECEKTIQKMVITEAQGSRTESIFAHSEALKRNKVPDSIISFLVSITDPSPENRPSSSEAITVIEGLLNSDEFSR